MTEEKVVYGAGEIEDRKEHSYLALIKHCHGIVWEYRRQLEHVWPTPDTRNCLLFAATELGEMIDAYLRMNPEFKRNNPQKQTEFLDEAADLAMMLLSAVGEHVEWDRVPRPSLSFPDISNYLNTLGWALIMCEVPPMLYRCCFELVWEIAHTQDINLPERLTQRLERIRHKHTAVMDGDTGYTW